MKPALRIVESNAFKIEKGIKIPTSIRGDIIYPFGDMLKGDSFLAPAVGDVELQRTRNKLGKQVKLFVKRFGVEYQFTTRSMDGGVRCWRVK